VAERTAQLQAANLELEAFSYSVSHDLRAPLRGIDGWSLALLEDCGAQLDEQGHKYLARVRSETQRMECLIDDLLQLSRLTRSEMRFAPVDISALAQVIVERLKETQDGRTIEFTIQPGLVAQCDRDLLEIALGNLFNNACKFSSTRLLSQVEFGQTLQNGKLVFFVRDNGVGFDMIYAKKLFGAFQRLHKQSEFPGTGIGLATVQRIINRHGGQLWADSKPDMGATFYFTLETAN
jgi:light-regulated signal transduction histidine kinase (bacteriophytochrome)